MPCGNHGLSSDYHQMWTIIGRNGPNHLRLWLNQAQAGRAWQTRARTPAVGERCVRRTRRSRNRAVGPRTARRHSRRRSRRARCSVVWRRTTPTTPSCKGPCREPRWLVRLVSALSESGLSQNLSVVLAGLGWFNRASPPKHSERPVAGLPAASSQPRRVLP